MASELPEDVKTAAYEAMKTVDELGALGVISRAILAERQRCADVAKKVAEEAYGDTSAIGAAAMIRGRIIS